MLLGFTRRLGFARRPGCTRRLGFTRRPPWQRALLLLVALAVLALLVAEGIETGSAATAVAAVLTGALCVGALVVPEVWFTRAATLAALGSLALSGVMTRLATRPEVTFGVAELAALLLLTTRAARVERRLVRGTALLLLLGLATAAEPLRIQPGEYENIGTYFMPLLAFGYCLMVILGLYLRLLDNYRARERDRELQEQRLEHARELHDFVAHHVTAMVAQTKAVRYTSAQGMTPDPADLDVLLAGIERAGAQAMESMRGMVSMLRSDDRDAPGARPDGHLGALRELTDAVAAAGTPAAFVLDPALHEVAVTPELATTVHRVVREALTNVRKHGEGVTAVTVDVRLRAGDRDRLCVAVTDDGRPAKPPAPGAGGYGLVGLTERVEALGGTLGTGPREDGPHGRGWQVSAELPLRAAVSGQRR